MSGLKRNLRQLTRGQLEQWLKEQGEPAYRAGQIQEWLWQKGAVSFSEMSNVPMKLRQKLAEQFLFAPLSINQRQQSRDQTIKLRFVTHEGFRIEGVLIFSEGRVTACVSSQVGCSLTCAFCATGRMGRQRNLSSDEIVEQVLLLRKEALQAAGTSLTNVVYMGMGEPLLNYREVVRSLEMLTAPDGLALSPRRITVSTAGIAKLMRRLADDGVRVRLALSLHATTDEQRNRIMPINEENQLESLIAALRYYHERSGSRISLEYILFAGFNDTMEDARRLLKLARQLPGVHVNLIEYNEVPGLSFRGSDAVTVKRFQEFLERYGIAATVRHSRGRDIDAACGQLANRGMKEQR
ncbi:MAG: 23S rRNA (adenine(2503)-C(2))-methyltransferase RlmN [Chitinophagales bacterium]|nr:23S rRNA (adenine(2503)-C(2))-methyltransferase RlmN [Chitinophagales bacterium]MDW8393791.1 23S rRNA (adenine(2503)-C(2))-methyltransferase RlmN [Chitinophagales bacterium]